MNINLTEKAKEKLLEYNKNNVPVKVKITGYSWCGARFGVVSEKQEENDKAYNVDGVDLIVSEELEGAMKGLKINYSTHWLNKGFEVLPEF